MLCEPVKDYFGIISFGYFLVEITSLLIVLLSLALRSLYLMCLKSIGGYHSLSGLYSAFILGAFFIYFLNYCVVYLLGPINNNIDTQYPGQTIANLSPSAGSFSSWGMILDSGLYNNVNIYWAADAGNAVQFLLWLLLLSYLGEVAALIGIDYLKRAIDQKKWCCPKRFPKSKETNEKTIPAYIKKY